MADELKEKGIVAIGWGDIRDLELNGTISFISMNNKVEIHCRIESGAECSAPSYV